MTLKALARHRGTMEAGPAQQRATARPQHRAALLPPAVLTGLLALVVLLALAVVVIGVAVR